MTNDADVDGECGACGTKFNKDGWPISDGDGPTEPESREVDVVCEQCDGKGWYPKGIRVIDNDWYFDRVFKRMSYTKVRHVDDIKTVTVDVAAPCGHCEQTGKQRRTLS